MASWVDQLAYFFHLKSKAETFPQSQNPSAVQALMAPRGRKLQQTYPGQASPAVPQTADEMRQLLQQQRMAGVGRVVDTMARPVDAGSDFQGSKALLMLRPVVRSPEAINAVVANALYSPNPAGRDPRLVESIRDAQEVAKYEVDVARQLSVIDP